MVRTGVTLALYKCQMLGFCRNGVATHYQIPDFKERKSENRTNYAPRSRINSVSIRCFCLIGSWRWCINPICPKHEELISLSGAGILIANDFIVALISMGFYSVSGCVWQARNWRRKNNLSLVSFLSESVIVKKVGNVE